MGESQEVKPTETSGCWEVADKNRLQGGHPLLGRVTQIGEEHGGGLESSVAESRLRHVYI